MSGITYPPEMLPRPDPDEEVEVIVEELVSLRAEVERLRAAAEAVIWFDWSSNDPDAVEAIENLRSALTPARQERS